MKIDALIAMRDTRIIFERLYACYDIKLLFVSELITSDSENDFKIDKGLFSPFFLYTLIKLFKKRGV